MGGLRPGLTGLSDLGRRLAGDQEMLPQRILYGVALAFSALLGVGALAGLFPRSHPEVAFVLAVLLGALAMGILASCVARGCRSLWPVAALCGALAVPQAAGWSLSGYLNLLYLVSIIHFGLQMPQGRAMAAVALLLATWCGATTANALVFVRTPDTQVVHLVGDLLGLATVGAVVLALARHQRMLRLTGERLLRRNRQLEAVASVGNEIVSTMELDRVFETIWLQTCRLFPTEAFFIAVRGPGQNQLTQEFVVDLGKRYPRNVRDLGEGLSATVVRTGKPLLIQDYEAEKGSLPPVRVWGSGVMPRSWMGAPMAIGGRVLGVISVQCYRAEAFDQEDVSILGTLANWAAAAIESARAHREQVQQVRVNVAMREAVRILGELTDEAPLLGAFLELAPGIVPCDECVVVPRLQAARPLGAAWRRTRGETSALQLPPPAAGPEEGNRPGEILDSTGGMVLGASEVGRLREAGLISLPAARWAVLAPMLVGGEVIAQVVGVRGEDSGDFSPLELGLLCGVTGIAANSIQNQRYHRQAGEAAALRELNEMKSRLIANISHELRTPLTSVQAGSELLLQRVYEPEKLREIATLVNEGAARLGEVVNDIIEFADLQAGAPVLFPRPTGVDAVVRQAIEEVMDPAPTRKVEVDLPEPVPVVSVDAARLRSVLARLVGNALRYFPAGSTVRVRAVVEGDRLRLVVADSGVGIPAEELDRVFEPFFRGDLARRRYTGGAGLGLAIVRRLVEAMGGRVSLRSQEGRGTEVVVSLPTGGLPC